MILSKQQTVYALKCELCAELYEYSDEYSPWTSDKEWFDDKAESGWEEIDDKDYCPDHWQWGDDDEMIPKLPKDFNKE